MPGRSKLSQNTGDQREWWAERTTIRTAPSSPRAHVSIFDPFGGVPGAHGVTGVNDTC